MKILDWKSTPVPTCSDLSAQLNIKPFLGYGGAFSASIADVVGDICNAFEGIHDELIELYPVLKRSQIDTQAQETKGRLEFSDILAMCGKVNRDITEDKDVALAIQQWLTLCRKASEIRNMVIHGRPFNIHYVDRSGPTRGFFLAPSPSRSPVFVGPTKGKYCWNPAQLREYCATFNVLRAMIMTVNEELSGRGDEPLPQVLIPIKRTDV